MRTLFAAPACIFCMSDGKHTPAVAMAPQEGSHAPMSGETHSTRTGLTYAPACESHLLGWWDDMPDKQTREPIYYLARGYDIEEVSQTETLKNELKKSMWVESGVQFPFRSPQFICRGCGQAKTQSVRHLPTCPINNALEGK